MERRLSVRGIIVHQGKLFSVKLHPYNKIDHHEYWCVPGGGLETGEDLVTCLEREIIEELGVKPIVGRLLYIQQFVLQQTGREYLEFFFQITNATDYLGVDLAQTSHGSEEIAQFGFIDTTKHEIRPRFLQTESFENLDAETSVKIFNYLP